MTNSNIQSRQGEQAMKNIQITINGNKSVTATVNHEQFDKISDKAKQNVIEAIRQTAKLK